MKVEFEFNVDNLGNPCIYFKHHERDNSLEQKFLGVFIQRAIKGEIFLACSGGSINDKECYSNYLIKLTNQ